MGLLILLIIGLAVAGGAYYNVIGTGELLTKTQQNIDRSTGTLGLSEKLEGNMKIQSTAFLKNGKIPQQYTCDGDNMNPGLLFDKVPKDAKSLVVIMYDPDVPKDLQPDGNFDHWVVYNIDPTVKEFKQDKPPEGTEGLNGSGVIGYTGPCPPDKQHRYVFKLYALDTTLSFETDQVNREMVESAMKEHIMEESEVIGVYNRPQNEE